MASCHSLQEMGLCPFTADIEDLGRVLRYPAISSRCICATEDRLYIWRYCRLSMHPRALCPQPVSAASITVQYVHIRGRNRPAHSDRRHIFSARINRSNGSLAGKRRRQRVSRSFRSSRRIAKWVYSVFTHAKKSVWIFKNSLVTGTFLVNFFYKEFYFFQSQSFQKSCARLMSVEHSSSTLSSSFRKVR
jgi:hypothetical protein